MRNKEKALNYLRPDGKSQVTVEYVDGMPSRIHTILLSTQHNPGINGISDNASVQEIIKEDLKKYVIDYVFENETIKPDVDTIILINPSGRFVIGGPQGDSGLTGRKIIVDTYGGYSRHGGGAFSGKDPTKVDRSAAYAARYVAKNIVASGIADKCEIELAYAIGVAEPLSILVDTFGTGKISDNRFPERPRGWGGPVPAGALQPAVAARLPRALPAGRSAEPLCLAEAGPSARSFRADPTRTGASPVLPRPDYQTCHRAARA